MCNHAHTHTQRHSLSRAHSHSARTHTPARAHTRALCVGRSHTRSHHNTHSGGDGDDNLIGGAGDDVLTSTAAGLANRFEGGAGNDTLDGGDGDDTLIVDSGPRIGDNWRERYHSLVLHNEVQVNHMPYLPFPPTWPVYIPKDMLAN